MTARPSTLPSFTPRERDVLRLLGDGLSNPEIAERLVVSPQTVKWYVKEVYSKLGVHSRDEALALLDAIEPVTEPPASSTSHNLPALVTSLVGRTYEIAALRVNDGRIGAVCSFVGTVRDRNDGQSISTMELEHYPGMTEKSIEAMIDEAHRRFDILGARVIHRVGLLQPLD